MGEPRSPSFVGAVLCGGASRRMGRDKASLPIDGVPMARRVGTALVEAGADAVVLVGGAPDLAGSTMDHQPDEWPGEGPLGGVIGALDWAGARGATWCAVLSCDLLAPDPATIAGLVADIAARDADAVVPIVGSRRQWTHAVWRVRARGVLRSLFDAGERSLVGAATGLQVRFVDGVSDAATADADTPGDLERGVAGF